MTLSGITKYIRSLQKEVAVVLALLVAMTVSFYLAVHRPYSKSIKLLKNDLVRLGREISAQKAFAARSETDAKRLSELTRVMTGAESKTIEPKQLPPVRDAANILKEMSSSPAGLTLTSVQTAPPEDKGEYLVMPVTLQLKGSFAAIGNYVTTLENSRRAVRIENISITRDQEAESSVKIELSAYLAKDVAG